MLQTFMWGMGHTQLVLFAAKITKDMQDLND